MAKNRANKSGTTDADVDRLIEIFKYAYKMCEKDLQRIQTLQRSYDNSILTAEMPTQSKIPIAAFYDMVEKSLPSALDYLFTPTNPVRLLPMESGVTMENVNKVESALYDLVVHRMKVQHNSVATLKDVFKCGLGYSIVEPFFVTPPQTFQITARSGGEKRSTRVMKLGNAVETLRLRYINPGQVVVVQDGSDLNGNDPVSVAFLLDLYAEQQFRAMYDEKQEDGEKPMLLGNPEQIIEEARSASFDAATSMLDLLAKLGGKSSTKLRPDTVNIPVHIPVLKCYEMDRHVWIANGTTKIYDVDGEVSTLRRPLIKATAWLDGNRFFPMSTPEAFQKISAANNIIVNLFLDMMTMMMRRPIIYNADYFDKEPTFGPEDRIRTSAPDARIGAAFMEAASIDPASMTLYEMLSRLGRSLTGQKDYMDKNFTRGGGMAFQDLMSTMEGIERMHAAILETGYLESVFNQALIYLQTRTGQDGVVVRERKTRRVGNKTEQFIEEMKVTENDLVHAYEMSLDLKTKARKGAMEQQMAMAMYDRKIKSPYFDPYEVSAEYLCATDEERRRQLKSREEVARIEQENRALEMRERAAKLASSAGGEAMGVGGPMAVGAGGEPGMQAEAGGMPLGEGETGGVV